MHKGRAQQMRKNHIKGFALATAAVFGLLACGGSDATTEETAAPVSTDAAADYSMLKVAVVYIGVPDDKGWTYQHEQGILALEAELGIEVKRVENVPEGDEGEGCLGDDNACAIGCNWACRWLGYGLQRGCPEGDDRVWHPGQ